MEESFDRKLGADLNDLLKEAVSRKSAPENSKYHPGKVVDNADPLKKGRCRIRVFGVYEDSIPDDEIPWAIPDGNFVGSSAGSFIVPPKDAVVNVYFDNDDMYSPKYTTKVMQKPISSMASNPLGDYPNTMVFFETDEGDYFKLNRKSGEFVFAHRSGASISISRSGHIVVENSNTESGGMDFVSKGKLRLQSEEDIVLNPKGNIVLSSPANGTTTWVPNTIPVCPFSGQPHGGMPAFLTGLKGSE